MLHLKIALKELDISQAAFGAALGLSEPSVAQIGNHGIWPKRRDQLAARIRDYLADQGATPEQIRTAFERVDGSTKQPPQKEDDMYLRHQRLHPETLRTFKLRKDPFRDDLNGPEDVFFSPEHRYISEEMMQTAKRGGMLAVIGESGSGKTTLRTLLLERLAEEPVIIIEPSILGMEEDNSRGRVVKADAVAASIVSAFPGHTPKGGIEAKTRQIGKLLQDSVQGGYSHVLIIEEAHSLSLATLKHLKRFAEIGRGFRKWLGIILVGQPELLTKLSQRSAEVREVVQRITPITLPPLGEHLPAYVAFKLDRIGAKTEAIFAPDAMPAIADCLTDSHNGSRVHPLAVNNLLTAAMNLAAGIGSSKVTGDIIKRAIREARQ
ncbi:MAG: AAA family ATPase [Magnetococcales bacterium]|nr:AAA family ATPase [Magnetococcales bacterium]